MWEVVRTMLAVLRPILVSKLVAARAYLYLHAALPHAFHMWLHIFGSDIAARDDCPVGA